MLFLATFAAMTNIEQAAPVATQREVPTAPAGNPGGPLARSAAGAGRRALLCLLTTLVVACGGGDGGADGASIPSIASANKCSPDNTLARDAGGNLTGRYASGTLADERAFVRSYMDEAYLWYGEVPEVDVSLPTYNATPAQVALAGYFEALKTPALTPGNLRKDRFSFTMSTAQWNALAQTGVVGGYGIEWALASATPPRNARVVYVENGTQAAGAGVARGDALLQVVVDDVAIDFVNTTDSAQIAKLNEVIFSPAQGRQATFKLRGNDGVERNVALAASSVTTTPVKQATVIEAEGGNVGYLLFNDFILPGEAQLKSAFETFRAANISDLVLDLRYNGGGYLFMASQLAYMIAPAARTAGKTFERSMYSDKRQAASNSSSSNMPFLATSSGVAGTGTLPNASLPNLALNRVYVLTTAGTCSASESVINGLRGIDVEVIVLGSSTCGKPYGFTAKDNCGISYFPVEFKGVNEKGFGDFADGFAPTCAVADDLDSPLGAQSEGMLAAALAYRATGSCAPIAAGAAARAKEGDATRASLFEGTVVRPPVRSNKFLMD